ncbi:dienelactone hydrolase family protein [Nocardia asteroides]|uniref:dienelactone hydrolase family protein n=1 Tax=Nocardia asteroides TaxID=1824 RepID=UPI0037CCC0EF
MVSEEVRYSANGVTYVGQLAAPEIDGRHPGLLVAHEAPGLSAHTVEVAHRLAGLGYVAVAIDFVGAGRLMSTMPEVQQAIQGWEADPTQLRAACGAAHELLLARADVDSARIGGLGYCFGGQALVEYARTGADLKAVAGFHAGMSVNRPDESRAIRTPLLMLMGAADPISTGAQRSAFEAEMNAAGVSWSMVVYGGVGHSFTNPAAGDAGIDGVAYDAAADADSWAHTLRWLDERGLDVDR